MAEAVPCILGVDPGVTGGLAFYFPSFPGRVLAEDIPVVDKHVDIDGLVSRLKQLGPTVAVIERASSRPGQGVASVFKFGEAYGALKAACVALEIPMHIVTPSVWKKHFRLNEDKEKSRALAISLWPGMGHFSRKCDHGRAEAALIARWFAETSPSLRLAGEAA